MIERSKWRKKVNWICIKVFLKVKKLLTDWWVEQVKWNQFESNVIALHTEINKEKK